MYQAKRPGPLTAVAVLFFLFGGLGTVFSLCGLGGVSIFLSIMSNPPPPAPGQPDVWELFRMLDRAAPTLKYYFVGTMAVSLLLCIIEVTAGFGVLRLRYWGRNLGLFYAIASIIFAVGQAAYSQTVLNPAMKKWQGDVNTWMQEETKKAQGKGGGAAPPPPPMAGNPFLDAAGSAVGAAINLLYPTVILILLLMPASRKAFAVANGYAPPDDPDADDFDRRRDDDLDRRDREPRYDDRGDGADEYRFRAE